MQNQNVQELQEKLKWAGSIAEVEQIKKQLDAAELEAQLDENKRRIAQAEKERKEEEARAAQRELVFKEYQACMKSLEVGENEMIGLAIALVDSVAERSATYYKAQKIAKQINNDPEYSYSVYVPDIESFQANSIETKDLTRGLVERVLDLYTRNKKKNREPLPVTPEIIKAHPSRWG